MSMAIVRTGRYSNSPTYDLTKIEAEELGKCYRSPSYFINNYAYIYDGASGTWILFKLWPAQEAALKVLHENQQTCILKARQLGMTWCCLAYALWSMIFRPIASVLIFSKRDTDATYLLSEDRLRGMFDRLPDWMKDGHSMVSDNAHEWSIENGSAARAFPTSAGDSYTATLAIVDEADLAPDLNSLLRGVKPTIDNGGKIVLLSRADKDKPRSPFKQTYIEAKTGANGWACIFLPWYVHPARSKEWYERQKVDIQSRTGSLDDLYEQYPETDAEAMRPRATDKRIPHEWLERIYVPQDGDPNLGMAGLLVYERPKQHVEYAIGADPAEGNPNSDASSATVLNLMTGEEAAVLSGKIQPGTFADNLQMLSRFYNDASVLVERNNHGHAVLLKLSEDGFEGTLNGFDNKPGWYNTSKGKALMYSHVVEIIGNKETTIHNLITYQQLASIVGSTLKAPDQEHDDQATSFTLANCARLILLGGDVGMISSPMLGRQSAPSQEDYLFAVSQGSRPISTVKTVSIKRTTKRVVHAEPIIH